MGAASETMRRFATPVRLAKRVDEQTFTASSQERGGAADVRLDPPLRIEVVEQGTRDADGHLARPDGLRREPALVAQEVYLPAPMVSGQFHTERSIALADRPEPLS